MRLSITARVLTYAALIAIAATMAVPFLWMLSASFKPRAEVESFNFIPKDPQPQNYLVVWGQRNPVGEDKPLNIMFGKWYFNSIFIAAWVAAMRSSNRSVTA